MRVEKLHLTNFRGFRDVELTFEDDVTVLVGVNGAGKTSVLDAIREGLRRLSDALANEGAEEPLHPQNIRRGENRGAFELTLTAASRTSAFRVAGTRPGSPPDPHSYLPNLQVISDALKDQLQRTGSLDLAVHLATSRSVLDIPDRIRTTHEFDAMSAYEGALQSGDASFRGFFEWFREEEDVYNEERLRNPDRFTPGVSGITRLPSLDLVRRAIEAVFQGATNLRIERRPQRMVLDIKGSTLDVSQLSDGEKCLLAMTGDIARRMVLADPVSDNPLHQQAVVLIDELELHLHPGLQRTILPRLRAVFPNTQFIVSTHSPQVLSSVHSRNIRLLENFELKPLEHETWRRDTNRILEGVFDDPGRPPEIAQKLNRLRDAIDEERVPAARQLIADLKTMLEGDDPDVVFYEQLLPPSSAP